MIRVCQAVAVAGGVLTLALALLVMASVLGRWLWGQPVPGDFEFVQMGTALAIFAFLPLAQARGGNVIVDSFTTRLPPRFRNTIDAAWNLVYAATMATIAVSMVRGTLENRDNHTATMVLQLPVWPALAVSTALLILLAAVAAWTALARPKGPGA
ncbi:MAG: TRAP transporter small permease [Alphaproteobacteria bacterium]|nr:TRAP transporter small permease [Alphaproteobacteria bacterium]